MVYTEKNLKVVCQECVELIQIQASKKKIDLIFDYDDKHLPALFRTDHNRVSQIVLNLLNNALKFTFKGSITLKVESYEEYIRFSVCDTGIGIKEQDQLKLFKAFGKIDLGEEMVINSRGVGLGLTISNALVKLLGPPKQIGIELHSQAGVGSTFSFLLAEKIVDNRGKTNRKNYVDIEQMSLIVPNEKDHGELDRKVSSFECTVGTRIKSGQIKISDFDIVNSKEGKCKCPPILVVDDDCFNIMALESILKLANFTCDCAYNGYEALEKIFERQTNSCGLNCKQYKMILMDCSMPILDGFETTQKLRSEIEQKNLDPLTIVGCTAFSSEELLQKCRTVGMEDVLLKPVQKIKLEEFLNKYCPR
jgi:CheY-like chemotaxis protein